MSDQTLTLLLILSGVAHIAMAIGSMTVPKMLDWNRHLDACPPLLRQVFNTYAAYTKFTIISLGLISIFGAHELIGTSFLSRSVNLFVVIYWLGRLGVGFIYYDRSTLVGLAKLADRTVNVLMAIFIAVHGTVLCRSLQLI